MRDERPAMRDKGSVKHKRNQIEMQQCRLNTAQQALAEARDRGTTDSERARLLANVTTEHVRLYKLRCEV